MEEKIYQVIEENNLIEKGDKILLGVSGGPDSLSMLFILKDLQKKMDFLIAVAHVNHKIREEANSDEDYVRKICMENDIEFYSKSIDVPNLANTNKIGLEEAGRKVRKEYLEEIADKIGANKIAVAHNKNDQAETILMRLMRGTGLNGLCGIQIKKDKYIRPLLLCTREEIEKYCEEKKLCPKIDKTNNDNIYTRNKIRNCLIPYMKKEFNPNIINTICRLSSIINEQENYMEKEVESIYQKLVNKESKEEIILDLKLFNKEEKVIKTRILRYTIARLFGTIEGVEWIHIEDIIKLCSNNIGNKYLVPNKKIKVLVKNHLIYFIKQV